MILKGGGRALLKRDSHACLSSQSTCCFTNLRSNKLSFYFLAVLGDARVGGSVADLDKISWG
jgi:hypothetical protein